MLAALVCVILTAAAPSDADRAEYRAMSEAAGKSADAHVKVALWCESHAMDAERVVHLARAVAADPAHPVARGLLGLVNDNGKWRRPEAVSDHASDNAKQAALLAQYVERRDKAEATADAQWGLSQWCDKNGLKPQAEAHAKAVTRIDPARKAAWQRLGYKPIKGKWLTDAEIAASRRELEAQERADLAWRPRMAKWKADLRDKARRTQAEAALAAVTDPRAVPALARVFATPDPRDQAIVVQVLGQVDGPLASRMLASVALYGDSPEVRRSASETLIRRDPREFVPSVIDAFRDVVRYQITPVDGPGTAGVLLVEGERYNLRRNYAVPALPALTQRLIGDIETGVISDARGNARAMIVGDPDQAGITPDSAAGRDMIARARRVNNDLTEAQKASESAQGQLERDVARIEVENSVARSLNERAQIILASATGQSLDPNRQSWTRWWSDRQGYAFVPPPASSRDKPTFDQNVPMNYSPSYAVTDCFVAGTPVRTRDGARPIDAIRVGDLVLAQDPITGKLSYEPVTGLFSLAQSPTVEVTLGDSSVIATAIHRFWKAGQGWVMARDLKPGDRVRTLDGAASVRSIEARGVSRVYNLEIARGHSFFAGTFAALVHDNTLVDPVAEPFDRAK